MTVKLSGPAAIELSAADVEATRRAEWRGEAIEAVLLWASIGRRFTTWDVEQHIGAPPGRNQWQTVITQCVRTGIITRVGAVPSPRPSRAGGWVGVYAKAGQ